MKKLLSVLLVCVLALGLTACGSNDADKNTVTISVATSADYPPYESLDTKNNIVGFDPDMIALFPSYLDTDETKYKFEFNNMSFDNIITQIQGKQADIGVSGFTYSKDRKVEWSEPYSKTGQMIVVPGDSKVKSSKDLNGKTVAAQTSTTGAEAAAKIKGAKVVTVSNVQEIFSSLTSGQYDAVVCDYAVALNYVNSQGFKMLDEVLMEEYNYIVAKEGNKEMIELINKAIKAFVASKDYKELCDKYGIIPLDK